VAEKANYWVGQGVFTFKGKDYGYGKELPAGVPEESIKSLRKKKRIAGKPPVAVEPGIPQLNEAAQGKIDDLTAAVAAAKGANGELTGKLADAENLAVVLTNKVDAAEASAEELAVKLKDLEQAHTELTGKLADAEKTIGELTAQITKAGKK
jgi:chromosome segregation ATPase